MAGRFLGKDNEKAEAKKPTGSGTRVSGYTDDPHPKQCKTCEYFQGKHFCINERVAKDKEVPTIKKTGLKVIDPINGCCSFWEAND